MKDERFEHELTSEQENQVESLKTRLLALWSTVSDLDTAILSFGTELRPSNQPLYGTDYYLLDALRQINKAYQCFIYECQQAGYPVFIGSPKP